MFRILHRFRRQQSLRLCGTLLRHTKFDSIPSQLNKSQFISYRGAAWRLEFTRDGWTEGIGEGCSERVRERERGSHSLVIYLDQLKTSSENVPINLIT